MTTTSKFQNNPDYYSSIEECKEASRKSDIQSNPRYKDFKQTHFTAGDVDQFQEYRDMSNGQVCIPNINLSDNKFGGFDFSMIEWLKYKNINPISVNNTFNYLFHKFKKGTFVKIQNNELKVFLPFSKKNFINEWGDMIKIDPKYGNMYNFAQHIKTLSKANYKVNVNSYTSNWYANNCLVRYEFPINEGDTNVTNMSDMLKTLCSTRKIPDIEFFMNRRDFPQLTRDETEPYDHIFGDGLRLLSHNYEQYSPILSMVTTKNHADIPIPTGDDWARISSQEGKFFTGCKEYPSIDNFSIEWKNRKPTAIFRGASTGCGVTVDTNIRLKLASISVNTPPDIQGPLLDAGISKWQLRPRKLKGEKYLKTIDVPALNKMGINIVPSMTYIKQAEYKYLVNVDGHVSAFRLSIEMSMGCCILLADSKYKLWFRDMLKPMIHYVPVKEDLSDLVDQIKWCRNNDKKCEKIAINARKFYLKYLQKDGILDYLQKLLIDLKNQVGLYFYNTKTPLQLQINNENKENKQYYGYPKTKKQISDIGKIPRQARSYGVLKGVEWIVNMVNDKSSFTKVAEKSEQVFSNSSKTISVDKYRLAGFAFIVKSTTDKSKMLENIHETFIGTYAINEIVKYIPNFAYVFGSNSNNIENPDSSNNNNVIMEYIGGKTLGQWINSKSFNIKDFIFILIQLAFALEFAQRQCGFVHYDLTPWNVVIQELPQAVTFDYMFDVNTIYRVNTKIIPVIIDYGKSHVIYENKHYGFINMFKTSTIQDIISIIITSLNDISQFDITNNDVDDLIKLINFLSRTGYKKQPFKKTGAKGVSDIQFFVHRAKKYTELISSNKYELEEKTPLDFVKYITINFTYKFTFEKIDWPVFRINRGNPRQVFDYILASNIDEKIESFVNVFDRTIKCSFPETEDSVLTYYTAQTLETNITSVWTMMSAFLVTEGIDISLHEKKYKKVLKKIKKTYKSKMKKLPLQENYEDILQTGKYQNILQTSPYTQDTFLTPDIILNLIDNYIKNDSRSNGDLSEYKNIIEHIILNQGMFKLSDDERNHYKNLFKNLLETKSVNMKVNIANFITLLYMSNLVYSKDKLFLTDHISKKENNNFSSNCTSIKKYMYNYDKILKITKHIDLPKENPDSSSDEES